MNRILGFLFMIFALSMASLAEDNRPNVLFIAIDDLNDWAGPFGGNPQCKTPNMDRFAEGGAVVFRNNHCAGPVCGPSRSALLSGFMPNRTGVYGNSHYMLQSPLVKTHAVLPEYFRKHGYYAASSGKIFHAHRFEDGPDRGQWSWDLHEGVGGRYEVDQSTLFSRRRGILGGVTQENPKFADPHGSEFGWAATKNPTEETGDYMTALWAVEQLKRDYDKPFFLGVGIFRPHLPWYAPQEFYDMYDLDTIELPEVKEDDLDDILKPNGETKFKPSDDYLWMSQDEKIFKAGVRAYMANVTYADHCLGVILDGLEMSGKADNTIVFIWGDHGWHLGEKMKFRKATIWSESTRAPLMVRLPGMDELQFCDGATSLIDMYPTLIELCGLPEKELDGRSFAPLLEDPARKWDYPVVTMQGPETATVKYQEWRYTRYSDGTEELYDLGKDPMEHENLIRSMTEKAVAMKRKLEKHFPKEWADELPRGASKVIDIRKSRDLESLR
ncbi:MAG: sulfatase [Verrucomicrobiota bacterium]